VLYSITVSAVEGGWMMQADVLNGPLMFRSERGAEDAAWRIATALAKNGSWAEIAVTTRDRHRVSRFLCPPDEVLGSPDKRARVSEET
jgi:hypothetical protein